MNNLDFNRRKFLFGAAAIPVVMTYSNHANSQYNKIKTRNNDALIVVDVQNDFLPGGSLAVKNGDTIIDPINRLIENFAHVVLTQDWHPPHHKSFSSSHQGKKPFDTIELSYGKQVLWPDHCVQGTKGAEFSEKLRAEKAELIIRKGYTPEIDSYSGFVEADRQTKTGLSAYLKERNINRLFVVGLATDFCVGWTAIDARQAGFETYLVEDACMGIDTNGSVAAALRDMQAAGVGRAKYAEISA